MASNRSVGRAQEPVTYTCDLCNSEDGVRWYCNDCHENLCDKCKKFHSRGKKTKNDEVVVIGKANRQGDKPVPEVCKLHPGKLCDVYCCDFDILMCLMCFSQTHKQHNWKHFVDEFQIKKQHLLEHMAAISARIAHFKNETSEHGNKTFKGNIDTMRKDVNTQRAMIKSEIDSIADAVLVELSSLEKEEAVMHQKDCQESEKKVRALTSLLEKAKMTDTTSTFEMERSLKTTLPLYDVNVKDVLPKLPSFVTGSIDRVLLTKMLGELHHGNQYEKTDIDSKHVQHLSKFTVTQQNKMFCICPVDDRYACLSINQYQDLVLVNKEGVVIEKVKLDFCPYILTMVGTTDIQVTTFADIKPHRA
ncbi:tripartite motif-containing protein 42-like [Mizuhopecten yessoensis]|uniref:tripartite motif-containing protein 42-like n=1 Tax=Mizuhopecten yessoensis TaxID=6573 RepID=UPI000B45BC0E|nr:tripartite motif-containing protein 42-like [Mizuhopecten yessoensis]